MCAFLRRALWHVFKKVNNVVIKATVIKSSIDFAPSLSGLQVEVKLE
jgi:hypothetical protein